MLSNSNMSLPSVNSLFSKKGVTTKYWCYNCKHQFMKIYIESQPIECIICHGSICEEIPSNENILDKPQNTPPQWYIPYNSTFEDEEVVNVITLDDPNSSLGQLIFDLIYMEYQRDEIEHVVNYILNNDTNKYGSPPASKEEIEKLGRITMKQEDIDTLGPDNNCAVCKDEFQVQDNAIFLPCKHVFHKACIWPWLNEHNSCPVCRFEMSTDDEEYERRKHEMMIRNEVEEQDHYFETGD